MKILILLMVLASFFNIANGQIISTFAGNGTGSGTGTGAYGGDGGAATAAELNLPLAVASDALGNIYIVDEGNNVIRKVNTSGIISTFAGYILAGSLGDGGPASAAKLSSPTGVAVDNSGNVYISDNIDNRIRIVNTAGIINTFAGNGTGGLAGDNGPATAAEIYSPVGVATDRAGNVYIADNSNNRIRKVNASGIITTFAGTGSDGCGGDGGPASAATFKSIDAVATDAAGNVYVGDQTCDNVRKINTSGIISTFAGNGGDGYSGDGFAATDAQIAVPTAMSADASGNIYIADRYNNVIRKVDLTGTITTYAGNGTGAGLFTGGYTGDGGPATAAELYSAYGVAVDPYGNVFIADYYNQVVRKVHTHTVGVNTPGAETGLMVKVYPNPSQGSFSVTVSSNTDEQALITITSVLGEKMYEYTTPANKALEVQTKLPPGIYFLTSICAGQRYSVKIMVE